LAGLRDAEDVREWTYDFYSKSEPEARTAPHLDATFGCFSYARKPEGVVRLHFRDKEPKGPSALGSGCIAERRAELAALFGHLKKTRAVDTLSIRVVGASWLYNLDAYRRLFPPSYLATARAIPGGFRSMSLWGQFLDRHGEIKQRMTRPFIASLVQLTAVDRLGECFPFQALIVSASAADFYDFYEI
jgi:hypothetical protein